MSFEDDEYWASAEAWLTEASVNRAGERAWSPRSDGSRSGRWQASAGPGPYNEAPSYEPGDELAARRRRRAEPVARSTYPDDLDDRYLDVPYPSRRNVDDRYPEDRYLEDRYSDARYVDDPYADAPSFGEPSTRLDDPDLDDPYLDEPDDFPGGPGRAWWRDDDPPPAGRRAVDPSWDDPDRDVDLDLDLDRHRSHDTYRRPPGALGPAGTGSSSRPATGRARVPVPRADADWPDDDRGSGAAGPVPGGARHRDEAADLRAAPDGITPPTASSPPTTVSAPKVISRAETPAAPRVISRATPPPAPRVISAAPQTVAPRAVTPSPPPTVAAVSRAAPAAPAKVVPPAPAVPPARVLRQDPAPPVPRTAAPTPRPPTVPPVRSWLTAPDIDPAAGAAKVIPLPAPRTAEGTVSAPTARAGTTVAGTTVAGTTVEAFPAAPIADVAAASRVVDDRTGIEPTGTGWVGTPVRTDPVSRPGAHAGPALDTPAPDVLLDVLAPDDLLPPTLLPPTLLPGPEPTERQPEPVPEQVTDPEPEQPTAEEELAAIRWRLDGATLREVVEDRDALRALGNRLDMPLTEAKDDGAQARLLCLRAEVYRLLGEWGMAAAASRLALARAEAAGNPDSVVIAQAELAHVLRLRGDFTEADRLFEEAASAEVPGLLRSVVHENAGRSCFDQGRHMEALDHFTRAIRLGDPEDLDLVERIEVALEAVYIRVLRDGWGPYPRLRQEILDPNGI